MIEIEWGLYKDELAYIYKALRLCIEGLWAIRILNGLFKINNPLIVWGIASLYLIQAFVMGLNIHFQPKKYDIRRREMNRRQRAIDNADFWFSKYIRRRDKICVICKGQAEECSHFVRREIIATRWLEENAFAMCHKCNSKHEINPEPYTKFYEKYYGKNMIEALNKFKYIPIKFYPSDIEEIAEYYRKKYLDLPSGVIGDDVFPPAKLLQVMIILDKSLKQGQE